MIWLLVLFVVALVILAVMKPEARDSLVRIGGAVLLVTAGLLGVFPNLLTGLLFWFSAPIALMLILIGTILSFVKSDRRMNEDLAALAVAAKRTARVWPDDPSLWQADEVAKHGWRAGPARVSLLRFESEEQLSDETWSPYLAQQAELALCRIYGELPSGARTCTTFARRPWRIGR